MGCLRYQTEGCHIAYPHTEVSWCASKVWDQVIHWVTDCPWLMSVRWVLRLCQLATGRTSGPLSFIATCIQKVLFRNKWKTKTDRKAPDLSSRGKQPLQWKWLLIILLGWPVLLLQKGWKLKTVGWNRNAVGERSSQLLLQSTTLIKADTAAAYITSVAGRPAVMSLWRSMQKLQHVQCSVSYIRPKLGRFDSC